MSENNLGLPRPPGQGSVPRAPRASGSSGGKRSIPRPVLLGVLGAAVAAAAAAIVVFHPGMPKILPDFRSSTIVRNSPSASEASRESRESERAREMGNSRPLGESESSMGRSARQQRRVAAAAHRSGQSNAPSASTRRPDPRDPDVKSKRVSFRDLDLHTHVGACTALKRIKYAAAEVCPDDEPELGLWHVRQECMRDSIDRAIKDTHNAQLQALYSKKSTGC